MNVMEGVIAVMLSRVLRYFNYIIKQQSVKYLVHYSARIATIGWEMIEEGPTARTLNGEY